MANFEAQFFCGIGMPKSGTTWLADYLRGHPDVFIPLVKELQVFNRRFRPDLYHWIDGHLSEALDQSLKRIVEKTGDAGRQAELVSLLGEIYALPHHPVTPYMMKAYRRLFRGRITKQTKAFGEFSTTYCLLPDRGLRLLDSAFPDARYVLVLRDPVARFWSHVKHQMRFEQGFDPVTRFDDMLVHPELSEIANYRTVVSRIKSCIPKTRLHIALYEDLLIRHDHKSLRAITAFLGISDYPADFSKFVYEGKAVTMPDELKMRARVHFDDSYTFAAELFGEIPLEWTTAAG